MALGNVQTIGINGGNQPFRVASGATAFFAGEPLNSTYTLSTGAASLHTVVVLTNDKPTIATDDFVGISSQTAVLSGTTTTAQKIYAVVPIPGITRLRALAKTITGFVDTDTNLIAILQNGINFNLTSAVYTWDTSTFANTAGFTVRDGNTLKGTLDCVLDPGRAMRVTIS